MYPDRAVFSAANRLDSAVGIIQGIGFTTMDAETVLSLVGEIEFGVNGASGLEFAERVCAGLEYRTGTAIFPALDPSGRPLSSKDVFPFTTGVAK